VVKSENKTNNTTPKTPKDNQDSGLDPRREARVRAFEMCYTLLMDSECVDFDKYSNKPLYEEYTQKVFALVQENLEEMRQSVDKVAKGYAVERMGKVDLALILVAYCEQKHLGTPPKVAINEALEIAKQYSTDKSHTYIHGVLGALIES